MKKNTKNYLISGIIFGTALVCSLYSANSQNVNAQNMPTAPNSTNQNGGMCMACPAMMAITSISEDGQPNCEKVQDPAGIAPNGATPAGYVAPVQTNPNFSNNTTNTTTNTSTTTTDGGRDGGYRDNTGGGYHDPSNGKNYSDQAGTHECSGRNCDGSNGDVVRT